MNWYHPPAPLIHRLYAVQPPPSQTQQEGNTNVRASLRPSDTEQKERFEKPEILALNTWGQKPSLFQGCGHTEPAMADIKVSDELLPYCKEQGLLAAIAVLGGKQGAVVIHPSVQNGKLPRVTRSIRCYKCVFEDLKRELARIKANAAATQVDFPFQEPSHVRQKRRRGA